VKLGKRDRRSPERHQKRGRRSPDRHGEMSDKNFRVDRSSRLESREGKIPEKKQSRRDEGCRKTQSKSHHEGERERSEGKSRSHHRSERSEHRGHHHGHSDRKLGHRSHIDEEYVKQDQKLAKTLGSSRERLEKDDQHRSGSGKGSSHHHRDIEEAEPDVEEIEEEEEEEEEPWLQRDLVVKVVDREYKKGRHYNSKVRGHKCICRFMVTSHHS